MTLTALKTESKATPPISSVHSHAPRHLRFVDGPDDSLSAVEFEAPPVPSILQTLCQALTALQICISDCATRVTPESLFQRFDLRELNGAPLIGARRQEVENVFINTLSSL